MADTDVADQGGGEALDARLIVMAQNVLEFFHEVSTRARDMLAVERPADASVLTAVNTLTAEKAAQEFRKISGETRQALREQIAEPAIARVVVSDEDGSGRRTASPRLQGIGDYRVFAPHISGLEPLWAALQIPNPTANDCVAVLRELARKPEPPPADKGVMLKALHELAGLIDEASPQLRAALRRLPLWTGQEWSTARPMVVQGAADL